MRTCPCRVCNRLAIRVNPKTGAVTMEPLGPCANRNVIATWCDRCGMVKFYGRGRAQVRMFYPRARVLEDLGL